MQTDISGSDQNVIVPHDLLNDSSNLQRFFFGAFYACAFGSTDAHLELAAVNLWQNVFTDERKHQSCKTDGTNDIYRYDHLPVRHHPVYKFQEAQTQFIKP